MKNKKLRQARVLMIASYALLLVFSVQWLQSQYRNERDQLGKDIAKLFTSVQQQITDSLLYANVVDPAVRQHQAEASLPSNLPSDPVSQQGIRLMLQNVKKLTPAEKASLFKMDTVAFNELFSQKMTQNGWHFSSSWVHAKDSGSETAKRIFIASNFFTDQYGVIVQRYEGYLYSHMAPQFGFVLILLAVTGLAFISTYKSLVKQIRLGEMKDDFVNNMSHELKTPIATVKCALEALSRYDGLADPERSRDYLQMAEAEMNRLETLVESTLNTSMMESGKTFVKPEPHDLKQLVKDTIQSLQPRLREHSASISFEAEGNDFTSAIDKLHTQGVLVNIIDNSLKYGRVPVNISITLKELGESIQLSVADNGPGIPEEYKEKVFEKFFRVPAGDSHTTKGYGLGLNYAAQVMKQQRGSIRLSSVPSGGCMFTLTF